MTNTSHSQKGSAFIVIIVILTVALVGALGFIFWLNFIQKDDSQELNNKTTDISTEKESKNASTLAYSNEVIGVKFSYPKEWVKVECDETYVKNPLNTVYFGTNNYGVGIIEGGESNLCGGGTDFPSQIIITRVDNGNEFTGTSTDIIIDGKSAKKYTTVTNQDSIMPGLEMTRYVVDMGNNQYIVFGYNRFPGQVSEERDNSESSLQSFTKLVEESVRFV